MTSWLVFHGSCGHTTRQEIDWDTWEHMLRHAAWTRTGRTNRAMYVFPNRFMICSDCVADDLMQAGHA